MIAIGLGLVSPLAHMGGELQWAHMAQHLVIGDLAAGLIVLGLTGPLLQPLLAVKAIDGLRVLTHPARGAAAVGCEPLHLAHPGAVPGDPDERAPLHALQHSCFIGFGILMWMPVFGPLPKPAWFGLAAKLVYVLAVRFAGTVLGNVFMWSNTAFYPDYAPGQADFGIDPIADQSTAGVLMTVEGGLVTLGVLAWLFLKWAQQDTERQALIELAEERGVPLSEGRAERAVAAGQGSRLAERIRDA